MGERLEAQRLRGERTDRRLDRAIKAGVREALHERRRLRELDEKITQLASAQLLTEEALRNFIKSLGQSNNGH